MNYGRWMMNYVAGELPFAKNVVAELALLKK